MHGPWDRPVVQALPAGYAFPSDPHVYFPDHGMGEYIEEHPYRYHPTFEGNANDAKNAPSKM